MTQLEALQIVLELAEQNVLTPRQADTPELMRERSRQWNAIAKIRQSVIRMEKAK